MYLFKMLFRATEKQLAELWAKLIGQTLGSKSWVIFAVQIGESSLLVISMIEKCPIVS